MTKKLLLVLLFLTATAQGGSQQKGDIKSSNDSVILSETYEHLLASKDSNMRQGRGYSPSVAPYPIQLYILDCLYFLIFAVLAVRIIKLLETVGFVISRKDDRSRSTHSTNGV